MKLRYLLPILLLGMASAAITPRGTKQCASNASSNLSCTDSTGGLPVHVGDTIVVFLFNGTSPRADYTITDDCGSTYNAVLPTSSPSTIDMFVATNVTPSGTGCVITSQRPSGSSNDARQLWIARGYGGVGSIGPTQIRPGSVSSGGANLTGTCNTTLTSTATGSYIESGQGFVGTNMLVIPPTFTVTSGTDVTTAQFAATSLLKFITSTSSSTGQSVSNTVTFMHTGATMNCYSASLELVPSPGGGRTAQLTDAMQTLLMASSTTANYTLPSSLLSPTWCTWVMPSAAADHEIAPASGGQLNGQANNIVMPEWQMTRLCQQDATHYWANPPLVAGPGITITPSPTKITISGGTPVGGAVNKIAGGTYTLPNENFAANTCVLRPSSGITAAGVQVTDVVVLTRQSSASGWGQGRLKIDAIPFNGSISIEICNSNDTGGSAINPASSLDLNWLVLR